MTYALLPCLKLAALLTLAVASAAPRVISQSDGSDTLPPWAAPELVRSVVVADGHTGETLSWDTLLERLSEVDAVMTPTTACAPPATHPILDSDE